MRSEGAVTTGAAARRPVYLGGAPQRTWRSIAALVAL
jgi:hypothetical protein